MSQLRKTVNKEEMERQELLKEIEKEFGIGCATICKERARQKEVKKYDIERDKHFYKDEELAQAAVTYALKPNKTERRGAFWPWDARYWNPTPDNRKREFEKAGALLAAQIDVEELKKV